MPDRAGRAHALFWRGEAGSRTTLLLPPLLRVLRLAVVLDAVLLLVLLPLLLRTIDPADRTHYAALRHWLSAAGICLRRPFQCEKA